MKPQSTLAALSAWVLSAHAGSAQCEPARIVSPASWDWAQFGGAVAVLDDVAVVGDPSDQSFCPIFTCSSGAVHTFRKAGDRWVLESTLYHSRISERDALGAAVAMDRPERFTISAPGEDAAGGDTGAIYIFEHNGEAWREVHEILPVEPEWSRCFGCTLALQGDTLVAGQRNDACWVYRERNGRWEFDQKIPTPNPFESTKFSDAIALDGDWLAVGAPADTRFSSRGNGVVHMYKREGGGPFELVDMLTAPDPTMSHAFGAAVAMDEDRIVVGAPFNDTRIGAAFVYELVDGRWTFRQELRGSTEPYSDFGVTVALHGDVTLVGASNELLTDTRGLVYLFRRRTDGTWRGAGRILPSERPSAGFSEAIATDGATIVVGAPGESFGARRSPGAAYLYDLPCLLCRADLDGDGELTFFDFLAFQNLFAAGDPRADFDGDGVLTFFDFLAFQNEFAAGCV